LLTASWISDRELDGVTVAFDSDRPIVNASGLIRRTGGYIISRQPVSGHGVIEIHSKRNGLQKKTVRYCVDSDSFKYQLI